MTYNWETDSKGCYDEAIRAKRAEWLVENVPGVKRARVIGRCELMQGDCLEILPHLERVDAVVTDPPYGIGRAGQKETYTKSAKHKRRYHEEKEWDNCRPSEAVFLEILKAPEGAIIWGGNYFADLLPPTMRWLYWDKAQDGLSMSDGELAWTSQSAALRAFRLNRSAIMRDGAQHPTQKPVALMEWCLGFLPNADTILDPFMGSGTTLVACAKLGRKGIGIELDESYFEIACRRVEEAYRQPDLFVSQPRVEPVQTDMDL